MKSKYKRTFAQLVQQKPECDNEAIMELYNIVSDAIKTERWDILQGILQNIDVSTVGTTYVRNFLVFTKSVKGRMTGWSHVRDELGKEYAKLGKNYKLWMSSLQDETGPKPPAKNTRQQQLGSKKVLSAATTLFGGEGGGGVMQKLSPRPKK